MMQNIFTLSDLHVSGNPQRGDQARFGDVWIDHRQKIEDNWRATVTPNDIILVNGDTTWSSNPDVAMEDLTWLESLPGTKYLCEGNHCESWWRPSRIRKALKELGLTTLHLTTHEDIHLMASGFVLVGTMGWYGPKDRELFKLMNSDPDNLGWASRWSNENFDKAMSKFYLECTRMRQALKRARSLYPDARLFVQTHFPPRDSMFEMMKEFNVEWCVYGHLHSPTHSMGTEFIEREEDCGRVNFQLASTDFLVHKPLLIATVDN
jgi:predicted phosphohydrolase